ncbi:hypothetical protein VTJ83DRAFT_7553 [Remersonia thermophila]|uniref:DNA recombination and repair protein Rad51-like C-terminal domain-containing protein n=1 Tax=Remersonia thermophila TaxID=72144 RepID=A0ABR4D3U3_9PEZI
MRAAVATGIGARMLGEVEETTLDEVLASLREHFAATITTQDDAHQHTAADASTTAPVDIFPFAPLNRLASLHFRATRSQTLAITGPCHRDLLYPLVATLIAPPHDKAVAIIDCEGGFDPLRLLATRPHEDVITTTTTTTATTTATATATLGSGIPSLPTIRPRPNAALRPSDLEHVYVLRPPKPIPAAATTAAADLSQLLASLQRYMLYAPHRSRAREWWGTVVVSSSARGSGPQGYYHHHGAAQRHEQGQVVVTAGDRSGGWLRVERLERAGGEALGVGVGEGVAAEAAAAPAGAAAAAEGMGWVASSLWGSLAISPPSSG